MSVMRALGSVAASASLAARFEGGTISLSWRGNARFHSGDIWVKRKRCQVEERRSTW